MENTKVVIRRLREGEHKVKVSYRFSPEVIAILHDYSMETRITKTRILEDFIRTLAKK